jgi:putative spermidine/putrescine transport system permease protein
MALGVLLPFLPLVIWSFAFRWGWPSLLPTRWSWRAWAYIASPASQALPALRNSLLLALLVALLALLVGVPAGRALGAHRFRGRRLAEALVLAPVLVPGLASSLGLHLLFLRYGLADTLPGVVLVHLVPATPYAVLVMAGVFANYDPQFEQQARVLGATPAQAFRRITLPAVLPGVVVAGLFAFLISWSQYILTVLIGGGTIITLPMLLFSFSRSGDNAVAAALALLFIAPAVLLLVLTSRFLMGGASARGFGRL